MIRTGVMSELLTLVTLTQLIQADRYSSSSRRWIPRTQQRRQKNMFVRQQHEYDPGNI